MLNTTQSQRKVLLDKIASIAAFTILKQHLGYFCASTGISLGTYSAHNKALGSHLCAPSFGMTCRKCPWEDKSLLAVSCHGAGAAQNMLRKVAADLTFLCENNVEHCY